MTINKLIRYFPASFYSAYVYVIFPKYLLMPVGLDIKKPKFVENFTNN